MQLKINGENFYFGTEKRASAIGWIIQSQSRHFKYQPLDAIRWTLQEISNLLMEAIPGDKECRRICRRIAKFLRIVEKVKDREIMIARLYDFMMALEGMGTLPGFSIAWSPVHQLTGNPEKHSLYVSGQFKV